MTYHGNTRYTPEAEDDLEILADVLEIRLREVLREDMSGVYGAFSTGGIARRPRQNYAYTIGFGCAPENAQKLQDAVAGIIASVKREGIGEDVLEKIREKRRRQFETSLRENRFWASQLGEHFRYGTDPKKIIDQGEMMARITGVNVQKTAKKFLNDRSRVTGVLMPEGGAPKADAPKTDAPKPAASATLGTKAAAAKAAGSKPE
jgi:zinc protease